MSYGSNDMAPSPDASDELGSSLRCNTSASNHLEQHEVVLSDSELIALTHEYTKLSTSEFYSEEAEDRIDEILELATRNRQLSEKITAVDQELGKKLGLLTSDAKIDYENQRSLLREYLGTSGFITPIHQQSKDYQQPQDPDLYRDCDLLNDDNRETGGARAIDCASPDFPRYARTREQESP